MPPRCLPADALGALDDHSVLIDALAAPVTLVLFLLFDYVLKVVCVRPTCFVRGLFIVMVIIGCGIAFIDVELA